MAPVEGQSSGSIFDGWEKWQIAVVVGAPVCLGLAGLWFYNRSKITNDGEQAGGKAAPKSSAVKKAPDAVSAGSGSDLTNDTQGKDSKPENEALTKAQSLKNEGNKLFKQGKYAEAIKCYTEALEVCPQERSNEVSTFYANRAAAFEKLKNPQKVIENCSEAIKLNGKYTKALSRRANAAEQIGDLTMSLEDVTAVCILEGFQNQGTLQMADRVLKNLGKEKAKEALKSKIPGLPSNHYIKSYFAAFSQDPVQTCFSNTQKLANEKGDNSEDVKKTDATEEKSEKVNGDVICPFRDAVELLTSQQYEEVVPLCCQEILQEPASEYRQLALLLRGTMYSLSGQHTEAFKDFDQLIASTDIDKKIKTNALLKRAALYISLDRKEDGMKDFMEAETTDPDNPDIFHHRGHQHIELEMLDSAIQDFEKSIAMNPDFAQSYIQKSYSEHRRAAAEQSTAKLERAIRSYEQTLKKFPDNADGHALYAQALCDLGRFDDADNEFQAAIRLEPTNANTLVHRALLKLQWKQTIEEAVELIKKAIALDEKCEYAYEILGTIEVQRGDMVNAVKLFEKAIDLCRKETELSHLFSLLNAAKAQLKAAQTLGIQLPSHFTPI